MTMTSPKQNIWFPAKKNGWGWGKPLVWQGWLVLVVYFLVIAGISWVFDPKTDLVNWFGWVVLATFCLLLVYRIKGEPPSWKWQRIKRKKRNLFK